MKICALIVAGGSGSRMNSSTPKQFLLLAGKPVLMHTIEAFYNFNSEIELIVALAKEEHRNWDELCNKYNFSIGHRIVNGGTTRFDSVSNGLDNITGDGLVAIHDGARPLVSSAVISATFNSADKYGSGVAAVVPKDSMRKLTPEKNENVGRDSLRIIQTPQTFRINEIKMAYSNAKTNLATDDATVAEQYGLKINLVNGDYSNIKITTPEDIAIAQALLNERNT